jgi:hypothetical protein
MKSPSGWVEPGQTLEFDEYTLVLRGKLLVTSKSGAHAPACQGDYRGARCKIFMSLGVSR